MNTHAVQQQQSVTTKQSEECVLIQFNFDIPDKTQTYTMPKDFGRTVVDARIPVIGKVYMCYEDRSGKPVTGSKILINPFTPRGSLVPVRETRLTCPKCDFNEVSSILNYRRYNHENGYPLCPHCLNNNVTTRLHSIQIREIVPEKIQVDMGNYDSFTHEYWPDAIPRVFKVYESSDNIKDYKFYSNDTIGNNLKEYHKSQGLDIVPFNERVPKIHPISIITVLPSGVNRIRLSDMSDIGMDIHHIPRGWKINLR